MNQEWIALALVGVSAGRLIYLVFQRYLARPLAQWLLQKGKVKWAMFIRHRWSQRTPMGSSQPTCRH